MIQETPDTCCTTKAGLTGISGGATTFSTGALTLQYRIKGKAYDKAQVSGGTTPVVDLVTAAAFLPLAANQGTVWVYSFDSGGTIHMAQGSIEALDSAGNFFRAPQFPIGPDTDCPFAYVIGKNGSTGTAFTVGTSNWNQAGMTVAVQDIHRIPDRPQLS